MERCRTSGAFAAGYCGRAGSEHHMRAFSDAVRTAGVRGEPWAQEWVNAAARQAAERW